jgi:hypothetical protein
MTDIRELEKTIVPPLLTENQLHTIVGFLARNRNVIEDDDYDKTLKFIEAKYARAMSQMTNNGRCINEVCIRVNDNVEVCFRVRGLHIKCRIWNCTNEFDL